MEHLSVAIADDNQKMLDILGEMIGADKELDLVGKAKNGEEMCQIIREMQPDVVLLDLIMPKMDGLTVMEKVGQDHFVDKRPYFIVITAVGQEKITEDAFNKGANYYVMKPFNNNMLLERIKSVRNQSRNPDRKTYENTTDNGAGGESLESRVTNMLHNVASGGMEQFRHLLLGQPNSLIYKSELYFCDPVFGLINYNLPLALI